VKFWRDLPGQLDQIQETSALGTCRTRTIAQRRAAEKLEQLGINSTQTFIEVNSNVTFRQQGEIWLKSLANRKRNPLEQTTIDHRRYVLDKWIYPFFESHLVADVNNRTMKEFVELMSADLAPSSIRDYSNHVKSIVASAINDDGEELFPRKWNDEYIDAPIIKDQRQPTTNADALTIIIDRAVGQYQALYALLAGCGPLRVGEALGLEIDKHISEDCRTLYVMQKAKGGIIQDHLKTKNGKREVDLCESLAAVLRNFIGKRKSGLLFQTASGRQLLQSNTLQDSLHPILDGMKHVKGGFNIFRRFRITFLEKSDCPEKLKHFWAGHAPRHVSERYVKLWGERQYRLDWAERLGTGFNIPASVVPLVPLGLVRNVA
jgi:hypothetical protein